MIILRLELKEEDRVVYSYFPEGETEHKGTLQLDIPSGNIGWIEKPKNYEKVDNGFYSGHAFSTLRKFREKGQYPEKRMVAWY